jgi:hypothetical protein
MTSISIRAGTVAAMVWLGASVCAAQVVKQEVPGIRNFAKVESTVACAGAITVDAVPAVKKMGYSSIINLRLATEQGRGHSVLPHPLQRDHSGSGRGRCISESDHDAGRSAGVHSLSGRWKSRRDVAHEASDGGWLGGRPRARRGNTTGIGESCAAAVHARGDQEAQAVVVAEQGRQSFDCRLLS